MALLSECLINITENRINIGYNFKKWSKRCGNDDQINISVFSNNIVNDGWQKKWIKN